MVSLLELAVGPVLQIVPVVSEELFSLLNFIQLSLLIIVLHLVGSHRSQTVVRFLIEQVHEFQGSSLDGFSFTLIGSH